MASREKWLKEKDDADEDDDDDDDEEHHDDGKDDDAKKVKDMPTSASTSSSVPPPPVPIQEDQCYVINGDEPWLESEKRDLKAEAKSLRHQLLHDGSNPHCKVCRECKAIRRQNKRRTDVKIPSKFGQVVTCDHVYAHSEELEVLTGDRDLLVVFDLGT